MSLETNTIGELKNIYIGAAVKASKSQEGFEKAKEFLAFFKGKIDKAQDVFDQLSINREFNYGSDHNFAIDYLMKMSELCAVAEQERSIGCDLKGCDSTSVPQ